MWRIGAFVEWWRRHPRAGAATVNRLINPWLVRQRVADVSRGEIGLLQHVGRKSGTVRVTPIHPVPTEDGLRIIGLTEIGEATATLLGFNHPDRLLEREALAGVGRYPSEPAHRRMAMS